MAGLRVTMTDARHSSGYVDNGQMVYLGEAAGFVVRARGRRSIYFAGDTGLFGDMRLIGEIHRPAIAFLPIGDRFTMGPAERPRRVRDARRAAGRADALGHVPGADRHAGRSSRSLVPGGVQVLKLEPGETAE